MKTTSLQEAAKNSDAVILAEVVRQEYDDLKEGESILKQDPWAYWVDFRILKNIKVTIALCGTTKLAEKKSFCMSTHTYLKSKK